MSIARLRLARGGKPPVSPLIPPSDTLPLLVGEHGQSPHSRQLAAHQQPALESVAHLRPARETLPLAVSEHGRSPRSRRIAVHQQSAFRAPALCLGEDDRSDGAARVLLVRHAEPADEVRGRIYGRLDVDLSAVGREHAERIAGVLANEPIAAVYTSPLRRAVATAEPLARALGLAPVLVEDLREIDFGELEGLSLDEAADRYPAELSWMATPAEVRFPGGESVASLRERAARAIRGLAAHHAGETLAVFSHAVLIRAVLADALAMPPDAMFRLDQSYGGISVVEWFDGTPFVRLVNARDV